MTSRKPDLLIVGAGPVGCTVAERAASLLDWKVVVIDRRDHVAGNCYDFHHSGVLTHKYGPHYFRTNDQEVLDYLSHFTDWIPGNYIVKSSVNQRLYPIPINLTTLEMFFKKTMTPAQAEELLRQKRIPCAEPRNSEEFVLSRVGREMFEAFYANYTQKQWGCSARELEPTVCGRVPIRMNRDERYVDHRHQLTPANGFTALFTKMVTHPNITVLTGTDFKDIRDTIVPSRATLYCGPLDHYFDYALGELGWRSLSFTLKEFPQEFVQPCVQINYPNEHDYTRTVEIKHVTGQKIDHTVVSYEYPQANGDPYYPIPARRNTELQEKYRAMADRETRDKRVFFAGRLADYKYIDTDQAVRVGLTAFAKIAAQVGETKSTVAPARTMVPRSSAEERLWVVMPVFNEEAAVAGVIEEWVRELRQTVGPFTFCVLDDGSKDSTPARLSALQRTIPELHVIAKANSGHGQTCVLGYRHALEAGADWVLQIDSDGQCDPKYFGAFWAARKTGKLIYGLRYRREDGYLRLIISRVLSGLAFLTTGIWVRDSNVPYRLMHSSALRPVLGLIPPTFYLANVLLALIQKKYFGINWIKIVFRERAGGSSKSRLRSIARQGRELLFSLRKIELPNRLPEPSPSTETSRVDKAA